MKKTHHKPLLSAHIAALDELSHEELCHGGQEPNPTSVVQNYLHLYAEFLLQTLCQTPCGQQLQFHLNLGISWWMDRIGEIQSLTSHQHFPEATTALHKQENLGRTLLLPRTPPEIMGNLKQRQGFYQSARSRTNLFCSATSTPKLSATSAAVAPPRGVGASPPPWKEGGTGILLEDPTSPPPLQFHRPRARSREDRLQKLVYRRHHRQGCVGSDTIDMTQPIYY